jgi:hypothetical protein
VRTAVRVYPAVTVRAVMERARPVPASAEGVLVQIVFAASGGGASQISKSEIYQMLDTPCDTGILYFYHLRLPATPSISL